MKKKQLIFYGPPGTGKTFNLREKAIDYLIADGREKVYYEKETIEFDANLYKRKFEQFYNSHKYFLNDQRYKPGKKPYRNLSSLNKLMKLFIVEDTNQVNKNYVINERRWGGPSTYVQHERALTNFDMTEEDWKAQSRENLTLNSNGKALKECYRSYLVSNGVELGSLDIDSTNDGFPNRELPNCAKDLINDVLVNTTDNTMTLWKNTILCSLWLTLEQGYIFTYKGNHAPLEHERKLLEICFNYTNEDMKFLNWVVAYLIDLDLITLSDDNDPRIKKYYLNSDGERLISNLSILSNVDIKLQDENSTTQQNVYMIKQSVKEAREKSKSIFYGFKNTGNIEMVTFHPSYEYEDFIEGISVKTEEKDLSYFYKTGVFKEFCTEALKNVIENNLGNNESEESELTEAITSGNWNKYFDYYKENRSKINWDIADNYVFIIDEINRGDIAKIFGECITLLENDKRLGGNNEISVKLPFTHDEFGIPKNIIFLCTMNTSDKSIGSIDIALRRRFNFIPSNPKLEIISEFYEHKPYDTAYDDNLLYQSAKAIKVINDKMIDIPFIGPDKLIGHSVLMIDDVFKNEDIFNAWRYDIFPMIEEYFFGEFNILMDIFDNGTEDSRYININTGFEKEDKEVILEFINEMARLHEES